MKRTTIKISDVIDARVRHEAQRRHTTMSHLLREAIEARYGTPPRRVIAGGRTWRSGSHDVSVRVEEILREEIGR